MGIDNRKLEWYNISVIKKYHSEILKEIDMIKIINTVTQTATFKDGVWEALLEANMCMKENEESTMEEFPYSVKTLDTNLERAMDVLVRAKNRHYKQVATNRVSLELEKGKRNAISNTSI